MYGKKGQNVQRNEVQMKELCFIPFSEHYLNSEALMVGRMDGFRQLL